MNRIEFKKSEQKLSEKNGIETKLRQIDDVSISIAIFQQIEWNPSKSQLLNIIMFNNV